jgi:hypothetical protein
MQYWNATTIISNYNGTVLFSIDRLEPVFVLREDPIAADYTYSTLAEVAKPEKHVRFCFSLRS